MNMKKVFAILFLATATALAVQAGNPETPVNGVEGKPIYLTKADFIKKVMDYEKNKTQWVYRGDKPAIIDFYADWCGPCKRVAPVLEELAGEYAGKIYIYKVNIDKERELAGLFGIQNIPTFLVIPMKGKPSLTSGASANSSENKARFKKIIDDLLK
jgi:thioredoxin